MAWLALFPSRPDELELDLHGYRVATGERAARAKIVEAQANGFRALRIHHGRSTSGADAHAPNVGTLKAAVLALARERDIARLLDRDPLVGDAATTLFFRPNRHPHRPARWTSLPRPEYAQRAAPPPGAARPGEVPLFAPLSRD
ncbi:MAG TPA: Smr/MutS family protein [Thermomicrobiales bacterium]|nr:Smr/MutS family protein [Thermomicrobiales bacterium]